MNDHNTFFEPTAVHDHLIQISKRPHSSGNEDLIREYVIEQAGVIDRVDVLFYKVDGPLQPDGFHTHLNGNIFNIAIPGL